MYAVIETGGKQYRVCEGDIIFVEKLPVDADAVVEFDRVVMLGKEDGAVVGKPTVEGAKVTGRVLKNGKAKKITVFTYRAKKNSKRKLGHRQPYSKVEITSIG
jgi:large subunit ribosomal protein L21